MGSAARAAPAGDSTLPDAAALQDDVPTSNANPAMSPAPLASVRVLSLRGALASERWIIGRQVGPTAAARKALRVHTASLRGTRSVHEMRDILARRPRDRKYLFGVGILMTTQATHGSQL